MAYLSRPSLTLSKKKTYYMKYVYIITRFPSAYGLYSRVKSFSNEGAERLSERNALTSEYNPYKRGTRVIKCLLYTPRFSKKTGETTKHLFKRVTASQTKQYKYLNGMSETTKQYIHKRF